MKLTFNEKWNRVQGRRPSNFWYKSCTARARLSPTLNIKFISLCGNSSLIKYENIHMQFITV